MSAGTPEPPPPDVETRRRIVSDTGRSVLVEASAGTGKTHILIEVLLHRAVEASPPLSRRAPERPARAPAAAISWHQPSSGEGETSGGL